MSEPWIKRRRHLEASWSEEDRAEAESERYRYSVAILKRNDSILRLTAEIERLTAKSPRTKAYEEARALARAENRRLVHELRDDGLSIEQTAVKLRLARRYVSELRAEPRDDALS